MPAEVVTGRLEARPRSSSLPKDRPRLDDAPGLLGEVDLLVAVALVAVAGGAALAAPSGPWRLALAGLVVFLLPGYLLLEAALPREAAARPKLSKAAVAVGLSPAVVGLVALSTALLPGGFRPGVIVAAVTVACAALAGIAAARRHDETWRRRVPRGLPTLVVGALRGSSKRR